MGVEVEAVVEVDQGRTVEEEEEEGRMVEVTVEEEVEGVVAEEEVEVVVKVEVAAVHMVGIKDLKKTCGWLLNYGYQMSNILCYSGSTQFLLI